ncbi:50S ribosomal protein L18e [Candidatus Burarchaeum australiense]|nr:50S ribosomal protein L18e [Candidatus Burarchaeum australiense]
MKRGTTDENLAALIVRLEKASKKGNAPLWAEVARLLSRPHIALAEVNVTKLGKIVPKDATAAIVPGVVLGSSKTAYARTVAAWRFTSSARAALVKAGAKPVSIPDLLAANPKGTNVAIIV